MTRSPAPTDSVRRRNLAAVLEMVHRGGSPSRAEMTAHTGLNRSTIGALVAELASLGLVVETEPTTNNRVGRPSPRVEPAPDVAVIAPQIAFALPTTIIILVPFLRAIPAELEDAAMIDGASRFGFFWRVLLPLSWPGLITVGVLAFVASWNAYLLPLLLLGNPATATLPVGVQYFSTAYSQDTAGVLAFTSVAMIPALLFFTLAQRRIVGGLTGAVKG